MAAAKKKRLPGKNIPEAQRRTRAVKLRLRPEVAVGLDAVAASLGLTRSAAVSWMVERAISTLEF